MTVIAYKDGFMAADRESGNAYLKTGRNTKVSIIRGNLVGCAGTAKFLVEWRAWFEDGAHPSRFPASLRDSDIQVLVVDRDGLIWKFESGPFPVPREESFTAIGAGQDAAVALMHVGKTAVEAVEVCNEICQGCGGGVDVIHLRELDAPA
jgi:hypothetical protein